MKQKCILSYNIAILYVLIGISSTLQSRPAIVFSIKNVPQFAQTIDKEQFKQALEKPGKMGSLLLRYEHLPVPPNVGIFATYWGYLAVSDFSGHISFIRHTVKPEIQWLVTPSITPVMMFGTTVHHWTLSPGTPAALYSVKQIQNKETKKYYWDVTKKEVTYNTPISLNTIVVFADPKHIYIQLGLFETRRDPNLILPDIYAKRGINKVAQALKVLTKRHFFSPVRFIDKKINDTYYLELLKP